MINCDLFGIWERFIKMPFRVLKKKTSPSSPYPEHKFCLMPTFTEYFGVYFGSS